MAQCFTGNSNEQGMRKFRSKTLGKKERVLSSPPSALQPPAVVNLKNNDILITTQRSASLNQILASPKAPSSPGLRNVNRREKDVILCTARALYGYPSAADLKLEEDDEIKLLRFNRGDDILVFEKDESGWWAGVCGTQKGIFPGSYVKVINDPDILRLGEVRKRSKTSPALPQQEVRSTSSPQIVAAVPVPQFSPLVIDHKNNSASSSTELLYEKYLSEQLFKYDNELLKLKAQIDGKDKLIELLSRENLSIKLEMSKMQSSIAVRDSSADKSVFFQKQLLETEMQLACSKVELEDINKAIQDAKETLKRTEQEIEDKKTNGVPNAHLNVAAIKKSLQLQHQLNIMKTHLDEETASRKDAEQQIIDSQKHMESVIQASKSKGFDLKIAHKINIVLAGMIGTPDLSIDQMMEMLRKLKDAVSAYILHSDMSLYLPSTTATAATSVGSIGRARSVSTPVHLNTLIRPSVTIVSPVVDSTGTVHPPTPVATRSVGSRALVDAFAC